MRRTSGQVDPRAQKRADAGTAYAASQLQNMAPAEAEAWVENNVRDLASAKQALKVLAKAVVCLARFAEVE